MMTGSGVIVLCSVPLDFCLLKKKRSVYPEQNSRNFNGVIIRGGRFVLWSNNLPCLITDGRRGFDTLAQYGVRSALLHTDYSVFRAP